MGALGRVWRRSVLLLRRARYRSELTEEMRVHREEIEREIGASGVSEEEARRAARRRFGDETRVRERSQEVVGFRFETVMQDLRFAVRQLRRNPGFTATAITTLALGICASVSIFAVVDAALIRPLPYREPSRLVALYEAISVGPQFHISWPDYVDWKRMNKSFDSLDIYASQYYMEKTPEGVQKVDGVDVSDGFFKTLGVVPVLGRDFRPGEGSCVGSARGDSELWGMAEEVWRAQGRAGTDGDARWRVEHDHRRAAEGVSLRPGRAGGVLGDDTRYAAQPERP